MGNNGKNAADAPKEAILHTAAQVRLAKDDIFFGPGKARLMEYIEKTGSMQEACLEMGLSYSKGARMIKMAEKQLGYQDRRQRGRRFTVDRGRTGTSEKIPAADPACAGGCRPGV